VYRWSYTNNAAEFDSIGSMETIITNIDNDDKGGTPAAGNHVTRTLEFDAVGRLYVSVGAQDNVDTNSFRSRIRRFNLASASFPIDFTDGEVFGDGVRNEVGLAFDTHGVLWGVENGADMLRWNDLGGDISEDNPAEELNHFPESKAGMHWGYPYCFTENVLPSSVGLGRGTIWAWSQSGSFTDTQCRSSYEPPEVTMQGHSAPLGITFYKWMPQRPAYCTGIIPFPPEMDGYAFIAFHGLWN
jgi:glucose/arabinose dehydrogenase